MRELYEEEINKNEKTILKMQLELKSFENQSKSRTSSVARRGKQNTDNRETVGQNKLKVTILFRY